MQSGFMIILNKELWWSFILQQTQDHFGKPEAQKISENETCRDWDPTDSNPNNPWHEYAENASNIVDENNEISYSSD